MDIHKPKPWHGLREFFKEYAIIVLGVLTALGAEQAVEELHWRHAVREGREAIRGEIASQTSYFRSRARMADCVDRHIAQVGELIEQAARDGRKPEAANVGLRVGSLLRTSEWSSEVSAQSLVHFPRSEREGFTAFYDQTTDLIHWRDEEDRLWDSIAVLDGPARRIEQPEIAKLRDALIRAKHLSGLFRLNVARQLERARALGVDGDDATSTNRTSTCLDVRIANGEPRQ
jgi:hypothetical protein